MDRCFSTLSFQDSATSPDQAFHNSGASKSEDKTALCSSETSFNGFRGTEKFGRVLSGLSAS